MTTPPIPSRPSSAPPICLSPEAALANVIQESEEFIKYLQASVANPSDEMIQQGVNLIRSLKSFEPPTEKTSSLLQQLDFFLTTLELQKLHLSQDISTKLQEISTHLNGGDFLSPTVLGEGAFGFVSRVTNPSIESLVAKRIHPNTERDHGFHRREKLLHEAAILMSLHHPNIISCVAASRQPTPTLLLEYGTGGSLEKQLDSIRDCSLA